MATEIRSMMPNIRFCQKLGTLIKTSPLLITAIKIQPRMLPMTEPLPPYILVPPIITAAITVSSVPEPAVVCALLNLDAISTPTNAANTETII